MVSAAIEMNEYDCVNEAYLVIFLFAAASAAAPGVCDDIGRYDCAILLLLLLLLLLLSWTTTPTTTTSTTIINIFTSAKEVMYLSRFVG